MPLSQILKVAPRVIWSEEKRQLWPLAAQRAGHTHMGGPSNVQQQCCTGSFVCGLFTCVVCWEQNAHTHKRQLVTSNLGFLSPFPSENVKAPVRL